MGAAWRGGSQPPLLPAQRLGPGGGVILHILHPAPPPASIKLGRGKSRPRALPIGRCHLPLWRDWLRAMPGSPDISSAIKFVGRGDLGFGGRGAGGKVGSAGGRAALGWLPAVNPIGRAQPPSLSSCAAWPASANRPPSLAGEAGGREGGSGIPGDGLVPGHLGHRQRPQP